MGLNAQLVDKPSKYPEQGIRAIEYYMDKYGIVNPYTRSAILGVVAKESGFKPKGEYSYKNTSNSRLRELFGSRISGLSESQLASLKKDDIGFYDRIYGKDAPDPKGKRYRERYGHTQRGDGFKYRGRGMNQLTFKSSYKKMGEKIGVDLVNNPELANDLDTASHIAVRFLYDRLNDIPSGNDKYANLHPVKDMNSFTDQKTANYTVANANGGWGKPARAESVERTTKYAKIFQYPKELYDKLKKYGAKGVAKSFAKDPVKFAKRNWIPITVIAVVGATITFFVLKKMWKK